MSSRQQEEAADKDTEAGERTESHLPKGILREKLDFLQQVYDQSAAKYPGTRITQQMVSDRAGEGGSLTTVKRYWRYLRK